MKKTKRRRNKPMQRQRHAETERRRRGETKKDKWRRDTETRRDMETKRPRDGETQRRRDRAKPKLQRGRSWNERGLSKLNKIFRKVQTTPLINDEKIMNFPGNLIQTLIFPQTTTETHQKTENDSRLPKYKEFNLIVWRFQKQNRPHESQNSIFQY